jgi:lysophospholipase L1-like esterase
MKHLFHFLFWFSLSCHAQYLNPAQPVRFLALGDSYTIGQNVNPAQRWPRQLLDSLVVRGFTEQNLTYIATTGWRTDNLLTAIAQHTNPQPYTLVSLLIGVNNQYQNRPITQYETEFPRLLDSAIALAGGNANRVFVLSIPDYAFTPYGQSNNPAQITTGIDLYNSINRNLTLQRGIAYYDITTISRQGLAQPSLVASDGLHPSGLQYTRWVGRILQTIDQTLLTSSAAEQTQTKSQPAYPVPGTDWFTLPQVDGQTEALVTGPDGKTFRLPVQEGKIWLGNRPKGLYVVQVEQEGRRSVWRLVKD